MDNGIIIGVDEAGRGPLAGAVFAGAVILPQGFENPLIKDSKKLSPLQREKGAEIIKSNAMWALGSASAREIDKINILKATFLAMHRALDALFAKYPDIKKKQIKILVDGNRFLPYADYAWECIVKGDAKVPAISAASIIAKRERDMEMISLAKEFPQYGWERNMGYPTKEHTEAIRKFGRTIHHRSTFMKSLDDGLK